MRGALCIALLATSCASLPRGEPGPAADALAHEIEARVNKDAWDATDVVAFTFKGKRAHLWDKSRGFLRVLNGDDEVYLDLWDRGGYAIHAGTELEGNAAQERLSEAWAWYCNDTFWLNPLVKLFDEGTTRELLTVDGKRALLVKYASGGVTPGDAYLWIVDDNAEPVAVRMWVSVLPTKGIEFTWEKWVTLPSGARVATLHRSVADIALDVNSADIDPFARLAQRRASAP